MSQTNRDRASWERGPNGFLRCAWQPGCDHSAYCPCNGITAGQCRHTQYPSNPTLAHLPETLPQIQIGSVVPYERVIIMLDSDLIWSLEDATGTEDIYYGENRISADQEERTILLRWRNWGWISTNQAIYRNTMGDLCIQRRWVWPGPKLRFV